MAQAQRGRGDWRRRALPPAVGCPRATTELLACPRGLTGDGVSYCPSCYYQGWQGSTSGHHCHRVARGLLSPPEGGPLGTPLRSQEARWGLGGQEP